MRSRATVRKGSKRRQRRMVGIINVCDGSHLFRVTFYDYYSCHGDHNRIQSKDGDWLILYSRKQDDLRVVWCNIKEMVNWFAIIQSQLSLCHFRFSSPFVRLPLSLSLHTFPNNSSLYYLHHRMPKVFPIGCRRWDCAAADTKEETEGEREDIPEHHNTKAINLEWICFLIRRSRRLFSGITPSHLLSPGGGLFQEQASDGPAFLWMEKKSRTNFASLSFKNCCICPIGMSFKTKKKKKKLLLLLGQTMRLCTTFHQQCKSESRKAKAFGPKEEEQLEQ